MNREARAAHNKAYYAKNKAAILAKVKAYRTKNSEVLSDCYVKHLICDKSALRHKDIPLDMVGAMRDYLQLKRIKKEMTNGH